MHIQLIMHVNLCPSLCILLFLHVLVIFMEHIKYSLPAAQQLVQGEHYIIEEVQICSKKFKVELRAINFCSMFTRS